MTSEQFSSHFCHQTCGIFLTPVPQSPAPAGCPAVHFRADTTHPELAQTLQIKVSAPQDCPHLRLPIPGLRHLRLTRCTSGVPTIPCSGDLLGRLQSSGKHVPYLFALLQRQKLSRRKRKEGVPRASWEWVPLRCPPPRAPQPRGSGTKAVVALRVQRAPRL